MACHRHNGATCIPLPVDAGASADASSAVDAGSPLDAGDLDAGDLDAGDFDAGDLDAGDAGTESDGGALTQDAGIVLVTDAGDEDDDDVVFCAPSEPMDAGCGGTSLGCLSGSDCCSGVCILTGLPTCADCGFTPTPDGGTCNTSGNLVTEVVGSDGTCTCDGGSFTTCAETCTLRGCPTNYTCNDATGICTPEPCQMGYTCPSWEFCNATGGGDPHGCAANSCSATYGCGTGGLCNFDAGQCFAVQTGTCQ